MGDLFLLSERQMARISPNFPAGPWRELIQIEGCKRRWFEDRGPSCTLLVLVDDATIP